MSRPPTESEVHLAHTAGRAMLGIVAAILRGKAARDEAAAAEADQQGLPQEAGRLRQLAAQRRVDSEEIGKLWETGPDSMHARVTPEAVPAPVLAPGTTRELKFWRPDERVNGRGLALREHAAAVARDADTSCGMLIECNEAKGREVIADELRNAVASAWAELDTIDLVRTGATLAGGSAVDIDDSRRAIGKSLERVIALSDALHPLT